MLASMQNFSGSMSDSQSPSSSLHHAAAVSLISQHVASITTQPSSTEQLASGFPKSLEALVSASAVFSSAAAAATTVGSAPAEHIVVGTATAVVTSSQPTAESASVSVAERQGPAFKRVKRLSIAGGTLDIVQWEGERMLRIWTPPGESCRLLRHMKHCIRIGTQALLLSLTERSQYKFLEK